MSEDAKFDKQISDANRFMGTAETFEPSFDDTVWEGDVQHEMRTMADQFVAHGELNATGMANEIISRHAQDMSSETHMDKLVGMAGEIADEFGIPSVVDPE